MSAQSLLSPSEPEGNIRRRRSVGRPVYRPDISAQLDPLVGCPEVVVPKDHLARRVRDWVARLDTEQLDRRCSRLGNHGYAPTSKLAVWIYASLIGVHQGSQVARMMKTDAAFRLLSGGYTFSQATLNRFRQENLKFFTDALEQTVKLAVEQGLVNPDQIAVDSMQVRAHASKHGMRLKSYAEKRLKALREVDTHELDVEALEEHKEKVKKYQQVLQQCAKLDRTSFSLTNESAALIKFPHGAALPGHRITAVSSGKSLRLVLHALVSHRGNEKGLLVPAVEGARDCLRRSGVPSKTHLTIRADAGFSFQEELEYANQHSGQLDLLIPEQPRTDRLAQRGYFGRERFVVEDEQITCPAGRLMRGPYRKAKGKLVWNGHGCGNCPLKPRCTPYATRSITRNPDWETVRDAMRERMGRCDAPELYAQRIAIVEPVFAMLRSSMNFNRVSSRYHKTIQAEIALKLLAYNISRLEAAERLRLIFFSVHIAENSFRLLAAWTPSGKDGSVEILF